MIPYDLIIPSASRPHLLDEVLRTLFLHLDQPPARVLIHDDAVFPDQQGVIGEVIAERVPKGIPAITLYDRPPITHGPALKKLLDRVTTEYVLYSQDDHKAVRDLPVGPALNLLDVHGLNQIRFNKRTTMDKKGREGEEFYKVERQFFCKDLPEKWQLDAAHSFSKDVTSDIFRWVRCCIADHWYFQTGVWRVAAIKPVVDWWMANPEIGAFTEHMEVKINQVFNGEWRLLHPKWPGVPVLDPQDGAWNDPAVRARIHKTFIWGKIGEPAFVTHTGGERKDWASPRANRDQPDKEKA